MRHHHPRSAVTVTDPTTVQPEPASLDTAWMSLDDPASCAFVVEQTRCHPGHLAVWLTAVPTRLRPEQELALWEVALRARSIVVPSRCALARVLASGVVHPASVVVIPLPTRLGRLRPAPQLVPGSGPLVVTPTSLHAAERVDMVLEALARLKRRGLTVRYHVVADPGAHRHHEHHDGYCGEQALQRWDLLQQRASRLGLDDQVRWSWDADPLEAMAPAQLVVLPWETDDLVASQALVDAISLGVPVAASSFPHAVELAPTGALTVWRAGSRDGLERSLHRVLTRPLLRTAMRHAARQQSRAHLPAVAATRLQQLRLVPTPPAG
jgi:glycosyltransferase involved in cell wall biosynthesis